MDKKTIQMIQCVFFGSDTEFEDFSETLSHAFEKGPDFILEKGKLSENAECPRMEIPEWRLSWFGSPGKRELAIFSDFLLNGNTGLSEEPKMETGLLLFIGKHCPYCPGVLRKILPLLLCEKISLEIIDGEACPQLAGEYDIRAVPTLMIEGDEKNFRWVGDIAMRDLSNALINRKPHELGEESLLNILESGDAERLFSMMKERNEIFPAFYTILFNEKWSVRLGAMVVAESLAEEGGTLGEKLLDEAWKRRSFLDPAVLGDMVYLMGSGKPEIWIPRLQALLSETRDAELKSAIEEALQNLEKR